MSVALPAVLRVTLNVFVPATSRSSLGRVALTSVEAILTTSVTVLTRFQLASTALTVMLNAVPAVCAVGEPVLPVADPGAAVSPGTRSWSFVNAPALTVMDGLVFAVFDPSEISVAVSVLLPAVFSVTLKVLVPLTSAALAGRDALASFEVIPTTSVTLLTMFQFASTAFTVTVKAVPAVRLLGVPVLPEGDPGEAVSPGTSNCSLVNAPALTVKLLLTADVNPLLAAVSCFEPATLMLRSLNVATPETVACVKVPLSVPAPDESDIVTFTPDVKRPLPYWSAS